MFPYVHIYFAAKTLGYIDDEVVLGAVFPDTVIAGHLEHAQTHRQCGLLYEHLVKTGYFKSFADGVITHGTEPEGLDYYCDEKYRNFDRGYAFETAGPLVDKVIKCCRLPKEMGLWKAHNFIEMASDLWLFRRCKDYYGYLDKALDNSDLILELSQSLARFYDIPAAKIAMSFPIYGEFVLMPDINPIELAKKYSKQTAKKHGINIDIYGAAEIIEEALEIVDCTFPEFLNTCQKRVGGLINSLHTGKNLR